ncbi:MAG: Xaa-Pro aminopeptidase [Thiolinea sp.]
MTKAPVISAAEFAARRHRLCEQLGNNAIAILQAADLKIRNRDAEYPFRQDSDFLYLTGFNEPEAVAVFIPGREEGEFVLFCLEKDPHAERWTGIRAGTEGAINDYGADQAFLLSELESKLPDLISGRDEIHYRMGSERKLDQRVMGWLNVLRSRARTGLVPPNKLVGLDKTLHDLRLFKSDEEITMMQYAADTAARAHSRAMQVCHPGKFEFEIEAEFLREFRRDGMEPAYTTIVGGGGNACILHYVENRCELKEGDLLLIDAGGEHHGYASDITRTFPVSGQFTEPQKQLYQVVLDAQLAAIAAVKPGNNWDDPHQAALRALVNGLVELEILQGEVDELIKDPEPTEGENKPAEAAYKQFFMHKTGHWLGLDVHDVGDYKRGGEWRTLEPGMVLTVEPGLYISPADNVDEKWWNIGIRIEDDVVVTEDGCHVLTSDVVKEIADIEALMMDKG